MRILTIIAARGGSKRVAGKNLRELGGRALICWSVDVVRDNPEICDVLVSTDDPRIAKVAKAAGAQVPWLRPAELASDTASLVDVCLHALDWYEECDGKMDGLLLLQPTSPFRSRATVQRGLELFRRDQARVVIGVSPAESHPLWCFRIEGDKMRPFLPSSGVNTRSQDLPPAYAVNGSFYLISPPNLRQRRSFFGGEMTPLIIEDEVEAVDIDSEWDWAIAEMAVKYRRKT